MAAAGRTARAPLGDLVRMGKSSRDDGDGSTGSHKAVFKALVSRLKGEETGLTADTAGGPPDWLLKQIRE